MRIGDIRIGGIRGAGAGVDAGTIFIGGIVA